MVVLHLGEVGVTPLNRRRRPLKRLGMLSRSRVTTNMIWKPAYPMAVVREGLYYTMGDANIF